MSESLPDDVVRLVIAARQVVFGATRDLALAVDASTKTAMAEIAELDDASEAFADRVPWDDEPQDDEPGAAPPLPVAPADDLPVEDLLIEELRYAHGKTARQQGGCSQ